MTERRPERVCSDAEIATRLSGRLAAWRHADGQLVRRYRTSGWKSTLLAANAVAHLAEAAWHHPDLLLTWDCVEVRLSTHTAKGVTDKDFELAEQIEDVVTWRPEGGALRAPPADSRHAHMKGD